MTHRVAIAADKDGNIWFLEYRGNKIGVFKPGTAEFHEFDIPTFNSLPGGLVLDSKRSLLWFTEGNTEAKRLGILSIPAALKMMEQENGKGEKTADGQIQDTSADEKSTSSRNILGLLLLGIVLIAGFLVNKSRKSN